MALGVLALVSRETSLLPWDGWVALALGLSIPFAFGHSTRAKLALGAAGVAVVLAAHAAHPGWLLLTVLLPTVIHVSVFTALFMLHGNLKSRSPWGHATLAVYVLCGLFLLFYRPPAGHHLLGAHADVLFAQFVPVVVVLGRLAGSPPPIPWDAFVAVGRFLGFIYTYHYLNWFSKTGIIRWHAVSGRRLGAIGALWVASVAVYAWDYRIGIEALFLLSLLHVLLELPLDLRTISGLAARLPLRS